MYKLRDYQEKQKNFLEKNLGDLDNHFTPLFEENISIESPTGSGKSVTMLSFVKNLFEKSSDTKVFISTGFNNLVYQIAETANEMGIPTKILIGKANANCIKKIDEKLPEDNKILKYNQDVFNIVDSSLKDSIEVFENESEYKCIYSECVNCKNRYSDECIYNHRVDDIFSTSYTNEFNNNLLVITNHSTLLYNRDNFIENFKGGFIDECQSFADFYESYLGVEVTPGQLYMLLKDVKENQLKIVENAGLIKFIEHGLKNGQLSKKMMNSFLDIELKGRDKKGKQLTVRTKHKQISKSIEEWISIEDNYDNYIHPLFEDDEFKGIKIDRFFVNVFIPKGFVCLVSATVDDYTKRIFDVKKSYREEGCNIFDYTKSNFYVYKSFDYNWLASFIKEQTGNRGILLSTRLDIVNQAKQQKELCGYEFIFSPDDFVDDRKQILCGSKSLFQGIDLPDVDFVMVNKIPFPRWDESYKKKQAYIQHETGLNAYEGYTIPYTENQLIQAMGRLWRKPGDIGNVAVFDGGLVSKHKKIYNYVSMYRYGINLKNKLYCK